MTSQDITCSPLESKCQQTPSLYEPSVSQRDYKCCTLRLIHRTTFSHYKQFLLTFSHATKQLAIFVVMLSRENKQLCCTWSYSIKRSDGTHSLHKFMNLVLWNIFQPFPKDNAWKAAPSMHSSSSNVLQMKLYTLKAKRSETVNVKLETWKSNAKHKQIGTDAKQTQMSLPQLLLTLLHLPIKEGCCDVTNDNCNSSWIVVPSMKPGSAVQHSCLHARPWDQCDEVNNRGEYLKAVIHKSALQCREFLLPCYMSSQTNSWKFCEWVLQTAV